MSTKTKQIPGITRPGFRPFYVNWNLIDSEQLISLYKFSHAILPGLPTESLGKILLDLDNETHRAIVRIPPREREEIQKNLKGISLNIHFSIQGDDASEILSVPIQIFPSDVMKRALLGKPVSTDLQRQMALFRPMVIEMIKKEWKKKMREVFVEFLRAETLKKRWKGAIHKLVQLGAITRTGRLGKETTIEDLLFGRYASLFSQAATDELINEGSLIQQTLLGLYDWGSGGDKQWVKGLEEELYLIGNALEEMKKR